MNDQLVALAGTFDPDARRQLGARALVGESILGVTWPGGAEGPDDREACASDTISDVLTAVLGVAGVCRQQPSTDDGPQRWAIDGDIQTQQAARALLDRAFRSWQGDAEDYTVPLGEAVA